MLHGQGRRFTQGNPPRGRWQGLALQGQITDPGGQGHLQPLATTRGPLAHQGLACQGPLAGGQAQGQRGRRQGLELDQGPGLGPLIRPRSRRSGASGGPKPGQ